MTNKWNDQLETNRAELTPQLTSTKCLLIAVVHSQGKQITMYNKTQ